MTYKGNRGINLKADLFQQVDDFIKKDGTYRSVSEFVGEATRLRLQELRKMLPSQELTVQEKGET